jgi:phage terminase large subunit GpA-like protein
MAKKVKSNGAAHDLFERLSALARAEEPPDPIAWIESHRRLSPESSREVGPFRFDRAPYMREVQSAILCQGGGEVVVEWASQCGKSELLLNSLLFWSALDPAPGLVVVPDWKAAQSFSVDRIRPMLRDAVIPTKGELRDERAVDSVFHMTLGAQMPLTVVHASGASALSMRPVKYLIFDEVSRFPSSVKGRRSDEGDPLQLAKVRTTTFDGSAKIVYTSSPVEAGSWRISELYAQSTQEKWHSRCPHCGSLQILRLSEMDFEANTCRCLACGRDSDQDAWQVGRPGQWIAENPGHARRGFWTNCFSSPFVRWPVVFEEYRSAVHLKRQGDYASLRVTLNTRLAETFTTKVELMSDPETLMARRENYGAEVPDAVRFIVASVDTQSTWLEWLVCGIAPQSELFFTGPGSD